MAPRYFVVRNPVKLKLEGPAKNARIPLHPNRPEMGFREVKTGEWVFIEREDYEKNMGKVVRLKDLYNVRIERKKAVYAGDELIKPIIHWVCDGIEGKLVIGEKLFDGEKINKESLKNVKVIAERNLVKSRLDIIQMERVGFARIEKRHPLVLVFVSD